MIKLTVEGMTCGHCVTSVSAAVGRISPDAVVHVDVANKTVNIDSPHDFATRFAAAIAEAGYRVTGAAGTPVVKSGCKCCA